MSVARTETAAKPLPGTTTKGRKPTFRPEVQGLRALAV
ncbi:MAG: Peptidoglycan/LPS O-acetylase OafA/YrhL, contains acyltransferase and SGNH-hydrolase domain, partial [Pseudarthrobacter sp.]|nr:Peptidoglycan/LPS O-acetylase OafA/YrhL, contains acyltransferase and SGNH-hydrolase domain [Pseudarthrobacter sp.]